jgi:hypothetical protein
MSLALGKEPDMEPSMAGSLPSVPGGTRQRLILCRVLLGRHSAKVTPLPSVIRDTRQRSRLRHPVTVTVAFLCRVPEKKYSAKPLPSVLRLCRVLRALGKAPVSDSVSLSRALAGNRQISPLCRVPTVLALDKKAYSEPLCQSLCRVLL